MKFLCDKFSCCGTPWYPHKHHIIYHMHPYSVPHTTAISQCTCTYWWDVYCSTYSVLVLQILVIIDIRPDRWNNRHNPWWPRLWLAANRNVAIISGATKLILRHFVKSPQLIWRSGTHKNNNSMPKRCFTPNTVNNILYAYLYFIYIYIYYLHWFKMLYS